jgi:23S rRNA (uracil1939-C5)-methyltransferase
MHLDAAAQLEHKFDALAAALGRYPDLTVAIPRPAAASPDLGYRTRLKWMVGPRAALGMYARGGGHEVVDTPDCLVASPLLARVAAVVRRALKRGVPLAAVDLREAVGADGARALVTLAVAEPTPPVRAAVEALADELVALPEVAGVGLNVRGGGPQVLGPATEPLRGETVVEDRIGQTTVLATFGAFVQAHRGQAVAVADALAARILALGPRPRVLELFAGSGAFGLDLARRGAVVELVESFEPAAALAAEAARRLGLDVRVRAGDAEQLPEAEFDVVVVDPPRRGLSPVLRERLAALRPRLLAYVSCNPLTLARDLDHLARLGLGVRELLAFDMIPQTDEVEAVAFLEPAAPPAARIVWRRGDVAVADQPPHAGEGWVERVRAALGWPGAVLAPLPPDASGARLVARHALPRAVVELVVGAKGKVARRLSALAGHSLIVLEAPLDGVDAALDRLAAEGHPPLGDARRCDAATRRHFVERWGLDRSFCHARAVVVDGTRVASALAPDLAQVRANVA